MTLSPSDYQREAHRFAATRTQEASRAAGAIGIAGESFELLEVIALPIIAASLAGPVIERYKKETFHGHPIDHDAAVSEISDVLWYVNELCIGLGIRLQDLMDYNVAKLEHRYPGAIFNSDASQNKPPALKFSEWQARVTA